MYETAVFCLKNLVYLARQIRLLKLVTAVS